MAHGALPILPTKAPPILLHAGSIMSIWRPTPRRMLCRRCRLPALSVAAADSAKLSTDARRVKPAAPASAADLLPLHHLLPRRRRRHCRRRQRHCCPAQPAVRPPRAAVRPQLAAPAPPHQPQCWRPARRPATGAAASGRARSGVPAVNVTLGYLVPMKGAEVSC